MNDAWSHMKEARHPGDQLAVLAVAAATMRARAEMHRQARGG